MAATCIARVNKPPPQFPVRKIGFSASSRGRGRMLRLLDREQPECRPAVPAPPERIEMPSVGSCRLLWKLQPIAG